MTMLNVGRGTIRRPLRVRRRRSTSGQETPQGAPEGDPKQDKAEIRTSAIREAGSLSPVEHPLYGLNAMHARDGG